MKRWQWDIAGFIDIQQLADYYANEHPDGEKRFSTPEEDDKIVWHSEVQKLLSKLYYWHEGRHPSSGFIPESDYDIDYFFNSHSEEELLEIAEDLYMNRSSLPGYDPDNVTHKHIVDNISNGIRMLTYIK